MPSPRPYRPCRVRLRDGREVTLRAIRESDAPKIREAFERLSPESRYHRFMQHKKHLNDEAVRRGVHPQPGRDFVFVATHPRDGGYDIVGAVQYVRAEEGGGEACEFAITVAEDWRGSGLASRLLTSLMRRARRDGYAAMEGWVLAENAPMLGLARKLGFAADTPSSDATVVRVRRML